VGEQDGRPYFTMEWVGGGSLADRLAGTPLDERQAALLVAQLARAVDYIHQRGVVHRDLKPANILLTLNCEPPANGEAALAGGSRLDEAVLKITDFGVAKLLDQTGAPTAPLQWLGTPEYMAPEQTAGGGRAVGPAVDVYALGVLLYEML